MVPGEVCGKLMLEKVPGELHGKLILEKVLFDACWQNNTIYALWRMLAKCCDLRFLTHVNEMSRITHFARHKISAARHPQLFCTPGRGPQKAILWAIHALFRPKLSQIWPFWPRNHHQMALSDQNFPQMSDNAQSRWLPMVECILDPILGLSWVPKGPNLLIKWPFEDT